MSQEPEKKFEFGQNWRQFLSTVTPQRVQIAKDSILSFFNLPNLEGKTFIDVGCGSGLFSRCAYELGASRVVSLDIDDDSVACCQSLHEQAGSPSRWDVLKLSVLDREALLNLGKFDIVYSFGVLHHTGHMWEAIQSASQLVAPGGYFYLTIYNKKKGYRGSRYWERWKRFYVSSPKPIQKLLQYWNILYFAQSKLVRGKNIRRILREYEQKRGMSWKHDMIDWIGGYPYEYATLGELYDFIRKTQPTFHLVNMKPTQDLGTNWVLFREGMRDPLPPHTATDRHKDHA